MLLFQKLVDETQMPKPQEYTDIFILTKKLFLVSLRGLQNISNPVERPCMILKKYDMFNQSKNAPSEMISHLCGMVVCRTALLYLLTKNQGKL